MSSLSSNNKYEKVLVITSSGGGGLIQAALAKKQQILSRNPSAQFVQVDMMRDWVFKRIGRFGINLWNGSQKKGIVAGQVFLGYCQIFAEVLFWPLVFWKTYACLKREKITYIIDTQPIGASAIIKAIRIYNKRYSRSVSMEKVIVDLPTKKSQHFFRGIKTLSKTDRNFIKIVSIKPLLQKNQTLDDFWMKNCGFLDRDIQYEYYIRKGFEKYAAQHEKEKISIPIKVKAEEEKRLLTECVLKSACKFQTDLDSLSFEIFPEDIVAVILLGSKPQENATRSYVRKFIDFAPNLAGKRIFLFTYASECFGKESLYHELHKEVTKTVSYPRNLTVIPMSFQPEETIAAIFHMCDLSITRSGGQTAMELMAVSTGKIFIHSETRKNSPSKRELLRGIPVWESGNASYLEKLAGGKIITPALFSRFCEPVLIERSK